MLGRQLTTRLEFMGDVGVKAVNVGVTKLDKEGRENMHVPSLSFQFTVLFFFPI